MNNTQVFSEEGGMTVEEHLIWLGHEPQILQMTIQALKEGDFVAEWQ